MGGHHHQGIFPGQRVIHPLHRLPVDRMGSEGAPVTRKVIDQPAAVIVVFSLAPVGFIRNIVGIELDLP